MIIGLICALIACFIWGTIFIIPQFLSEFTAIEVALGRYLFYGLFSFFLFLRNKIPLSSLPKGTWKSAFLFAFFCNILYYPPLVFAIRYASAPIAVLIVGLCPLAIALYGNYRAREISFRHLMIPSLWIFLGIFLSNAPEIAAHNSSSSLWQYILGISGAFIALSSWSIFAVHNFQFLKKNPQIPRSYWSTIVGLTTLVWTVILIFILAILDLGISLDSWTHLSGNQILKFFLSSLFLGIACSWVASYLWNRASSLLPISLIGPISLAETLFGLLFVFFLELRLPTFAEFFGMVFMIWGMVWVFQLFRQRSNIKKESASL